MFHLLVKFTYIIYDLRILITLFGIFKLSLATVIMVTNALSVYYTLILIIIRNHDLRDHYPVVLHKALLILCKAS
jgi:hypothetical protein